MKISYLLKHQFINVINCLIIVNYIIEEKYFFTSFAARDKTYLTLLELLKDSTGKSSRPNRNNFSLHKLVLLEGESVGKTSLTVRFADGKLMSDQTTTIVAAFLSKTIQLEDETIKVEIWDTAGQERFNSLLKMGTM